MRSKVECEHFLEGIKVIEYPEAFCPEAGIMESDVELNCTCFDEHIHSSFFNGVHIEQRSVTVRSPFYLKVAHDFPFLKMQFEVLGYSHFSSPMKSVMDVQICAGHHQLIFIPEVKGELNYVSNRRTLEIKMTSAFLKRLFGEELQPLGRFGKAILNNDPALLSSAKMPITPGIQELITNISRCPYAGLMRKVYLECKVSELLLLQLEQVHANEQLQGAAPRKSDIDKLYYAKELIEQNLEHPKTILQLSEMSGLNDFKLKRDFKRLFGTTIFGYLTDYRLKKARELLIEGQNISEVAYRMGYRHPQHFSAAYKRYYGYCPSSIKQ